MIYINIAASTSYNNNNLMIMKILITLYTYERILCLFGIRTNKRKKSKFFCKHITFLAVTTIAATTATPAKFKYTANGTIKYYV